MVVMKRISGLITTIERLEACAGLEELVITTTFRPERDRWHRHPVEPVGQPFLTVARLRRASPQEWAGAPRA